MPRDHSQRQYLESILEEARRNMQMKQAGSESAVGNAFASIDSNGVRTSNNQHPRANIQGNMSLVNQRHLQATTNATSTFAHTHCGQHPDVSSNLPVADPRVAHPSHSAPPSFFYVKRATLPHRRGHGKHCSGGMAVEPWSNKPHPNRSNHLPRSTQMLYREPTTTADILYTDPSGRRFAMSDANNLYLGGYSKAEPTAADRGQPNERRYLEIIEPDPEDSETLRWESWALRQLIKEKLNVNDGDIRAFLSYEYAQAMERKFMREELGDIEQKQARTMQPGQHQETRA